MELYMPIRSGFRVTWHIVSYRRVGRGAVLVRDCHELIDGVLRSLDVKDVLYIKDYGETLFLEPDSSLDEFCLYC